MWITNNLENNLYDTVDISLIHCKMCHLNIVTMFSLLLFVVRIGWNLIANYLHCYTYNKMLHTVAGIQTISISKIFCSLSQFSPCILHDVYSNEKSAINIHAWYHPKTVFWIAVCKVGKVFGETMYLALSTQRII